MIFDPSNTLCDVQGCILAHELMHAHLRMRNVTGLPLEVEEGANCGVALFCFCNTGM